MAINYNESPWPWEETDWEKNAVLENLPSLLSLDKSTRQGAIVDADMAYKKMHPNNFLRLLDYVDIKHHNALLDDDDWCRDMQEILSRGQYCEMVNVFLKQRKAMAEKRTKADFRQYLPTLFSLDRDTRLWLMVNGEMMHGKMHDDDFSQLLEYVDPEKHKKLFDNDDWDNDMCEILSRHQYKTMRDMFYQKRVRFHYEQDED